MRAKVLLVLGLMALLLVAEQALTQDQGGFGKKNRFGGSPGGPGGGSGGPGGFSRGPGGADPSQFFNMMTQGKGVWIRADIPDQRRQDFFDRIAQAAGVTSGQLTLEQFSQGMQQMRANFSKGGATAASNMGPGGPGGAAPSAADIEQEAIRRFKEMDQNGDGYINKDEAARSMGLRDDFARWDTNRDGLIDLNEYKAYWQSRVQSRGNNGPGGFGGLIIIPDQPEEERRPVVYRVGNLPKELPAWFTELDIDKTARSACTSGAGPAGPWMSSRKWTAITTVSSRLRKSFTTWPWLGETARFRKRRGQRRPHRQSRERPGSRRLCRQSPLRAAARHGWPAALPGSATGRQLRISLRGQGGQRRRRLQR